jgi:hypothetical protein
MIGTVGREIVPDKNKNFNRGTEYKKITKNIGLKRL